jgi:hypothetical protein
MIDFKALFKISYGLYIVCAGDKKQGNGFISNTVFQITSEPAQFAASCNKEEIAFEDLPDDWTCPVCGSEKEDFMEI